MNTEEVVLSNSSFVEVQSFVYCLNSEHISSSRVVNFSSFNSSFEMSSPSKGSSISRILSFIEINFVKNIDSPTRISSSLKFEY